MKTLWELPCPSSAIEDGGAVVEHRPRRTVVIQMAFEEVKFEIELQGVESYRETHYDARSCWMLEAYDRLCDAGKTEWLREVVANLKRSNCATPALRHLVINLDDGPCYEAICTGFHVQEIGEVRD